MTTLLDYIAAICFGVIYCAFMLVARLVAPERFGTENEEND